MFKTVHAKLLAPILCAIILGSLITGILSYRAASGVVTGAFEEDGQRSVRHLRESVDMVLSKARLDLSALSVSPTVINLLDGDEAAEEHVEGYIVALVKQHSIYNSITILNTDGIIVASTSGSTGGDRSDREYFRDSMNGRMHISGVELSRQTGRLATFISIPIHATNSGVIIGVALTVIRLEELNDRYVVSVNLLGDHGYAMVVTGDGSIIAHRDEDKIFAPDDEERDETDGMVSEQMLRQLPLLKGESVAFETEIDGEKYMVFAERSDYTDWYAIVVCPVSEFYQQTTYLAITNTVTAVLFVLLQVFIIWIVVRGITKALSTTVKYSKEVSGGSLDSKLTIERNDEVGVLADSLREMVGKLKAMIKDAEEKAKIIMENIRYASKIQKNLLPTNIVLATAFSDYSVIWEPRDIVGGDIYWAKNFYNGTVLCVCDCTGHGTPGALLTMLVVSAFENTITESSHADTAKILFDIDQKLASVLHVESEEHKKRGIMDINDGCDLAVLFIAKDGTVTISSGNINVFSCDGEKVTRHKGQSIFVGDGRLKSADEVKTITIPANPDNKFYISSDGMPDQIGGERVTQFGFKMFKQIILENHNEKQSVISDKIWEAYLKHQGDEVRRDDFELITFKPEINEGQVSDRRVSDRRR